MRNLIRDGKNIIKFDCSFLVGRKEFFSDRGFIWDLHREERYSLINSFLLVDCFCEKNLFTQKYEN